VWLFTLVKCYYKITVCIQQQVVEYHEQLCTVVESVWICDIIQKANDITERVTVGQLVGDVNIHLMQLSNIKYIKSAKQLSEIHSQETKFPSNTVYEKSHQLQLKSCCKTEQNLPLSIFLGHEHEQDWLCTVVGDRCSEFSNTASCDRAILAKRPTVHNNSSISNNKQNYWTTQKWTQHFGYAPTMLLPLITSIVSILTLQYNAITDNYVNFL